MTTAELRAALQALQIPPEYYSILEGLKPDAIVLDHYHGIWKTSYFSERGVESHEKIHWSESDACLYVLNKFKNTTALTHGQAPEER